MNGYYQQCFYNSNERRYRRHPQNYQQQQQQLQYQNYYGGSSTSNGGYYRNFYHPYHHYQQYPYGYGTLALTPMIERRQRAFHDAIYEEEYGSDNGEDCCQSRGMSALFCWFLSVIILIGLAGSIVLTVFFLLKSKSLTPKNEELDLLFDGDKFSYPDTTTELNSVDFPLSSSSKESTFISGRPRAPDETDNKKAGGKQSATTKSPPTRRGHHHGHMQHKESSEEESLQFQNLYPNGKFNSLERDVLLGKVQKTTPSTTTRGRSDDISKEAEESSQSSEEFSFLTTTPRPPTPFVLFTSPPITTTPTTNPRRNMMMTKRLPTERTSFTTSTEAVDSESESEEEDNENNKPPSLEQTTKSSSDDANGEKILTSNAASNNFENDLKPTEFDLPSSSSADPLARIIKNLAPKWGRNRTLLETTTMASSGVTHKYDYIISSREKNKTKQNEWMEENTSKEKMESVQVTHSNPLSASGSNVHSTTISSSPFPPHHSSTSSLGTKGPHKSSEFSSTKTGLSSVESPDLSGVKGEKAEGNSQFFDVLVGSEDHKTLVTKQTEDGIVTSAILPLWYDVPGENNGNYSTPATNNSTDVVLGENEESEESQEQDGGSQEESNGRPDVEHSASSSVLGGIFDFFKKLPINRDREVNYGPPRFIPPPGPPPPGYGFNPIESGGGGPPRLPINEHNSRESQLESSKISTVLPFPNSVVAGPSFTTTGTPESAVVTDDDIQPANNAFHYGTDDGVTNIYGYYPDDDRDNDKTVEHHMIQSETISDPNELMDKVGDGIRERPEGGQNQFIGSSINSEAASSEVVTDQDEGQEEEEDDDYPFGRYGEAHASSEIRKQIVPAPPSLLPNGQHGGGIRRPVGEGGKTVESDLEMKGSENRPIFANTHRSIPHQLIRQRHQTTASPQQNQSLVHNASSTTRVPTLQAHKPGVSGEITDNSGENDGSVGSYEESPPHIHSNQAKDKKTEDKSREKQKVHQHEHIGGSGSMEDDLGSIEHSEEKTQWALPDHNQMPHTTHQPQRNKNIALVESFESSFEKKLSLGKNTVIESEGEDETRKDKENGYTSDSADQSDASVVENKKVFQVFPEGYSTTSTTERPRIESTISEPEKSSADEKSTGFVAPTPVNFHENKYTFSPPSSTYQVKDGWRPIVYNSDEEEEEESAEVTHSHLFSRPTQPSSLPPSPSHLTTTHHNNNPDNNGWRNRLQEMIKNPITVPPKIESTAATNGDSNSLFQQNDDEYDHDLNEEDNQNRSQDHRISEFASEEREGPAKGSSAWGEKVNQVQNNENTNVNFHPHHVSDEEETSPNFPKDRSVIRPQEASESNINLEQKNNPPPQLIQFFAGNEASLPRIPVNTVATPNNFHTQPPSQIQINNNQLSQPQQYHYNQQQQQSHRDIPHQHPQHAPQQPQQQFHPAPFPHGPPPPHHHFHAQQQHQQHHQPHQSLHQQQQQRIPQGGGPNIDRSKYMMRPAPPPIMMRRTPIKGMGYQPNSIPPRPQLIPQVQQSSPQYNNLINSNAPPTDFPPPAQNFINRRRFKTLGARPRSNWQDEEKGKAVTAERRIG